MHAEIVMVGTELLLGEIIDTNATKLAKALRDIGMDRKPPRHRGGRSDLAEDRTKVRGRCRAQAGETCRPWGIRSGSAAHRNG